MKVSRLPYGITIHPVQSKQERQALCYFLIWNSIIKEFTTDAYPLSMIVLLVLILSSSLILTDVVLYFDQFLREPVAFLSPILKERLSWVRFLPIVIVATTLFMALCTALFVCTDKSDAAWLVKRNQKLIAYIRITNCRTFTVLDRLYIARPYRRKGIGSALIKHFLQRSAVPMYVLIWSMGAKGFYTRIGFQPARKNAQTESAAAPEPNVGLVLRP